MIIRFVTSGDFLFPDSCHELAVNLNATWNGRGRCLVLEYSTHVVEEPSSSQHDRGWLQAIPTVQEKLSVSITLGG